MRIKRAIYITLLLVALATFTASTALAGTVTKPPMTLTFPEYPLKGPALQSCEPWADPTANSVTLSGIPAGATVIYRFIWANPYTGYPQFMPLRTFTNVNTGSMTVNVEYPMDTKAWPVFNTATNERAIAVSVGFIVYSGTLSWKFTSYQWWVKCLPPLPPFEGCTPGYWKQEQHFDSWVPTGLQTTDLYGPLFGITPSFSPNTLLDALGLGGGGENALARHATAGMLNALHPEINYEFTAAQIISGVQNAYATGEFETFKTQLDFANNAGCPLD